MAEEREGGGPGTPALFGLPHAAVKAVLEGPAAWWCLGRPDGLVQWANAAAQALCGRQPLPPGASYTEWASGAAQAIGWEPWLALCRQALIVTSPPSISQAWPRLVQGQAELWLLTAQVQNESVVVMATRADAAAAQATAAWAAHPQQRDVLIREVHHRLKNNLQGVSGLLTQQASLHPEAARWLEAAASQLQAMAQVYGLQTQGDAAPTLIELVRSVAQGVASVFGVVIDVEAAPSGRLSTVAATQGAARSSLAWRQTLWAHLESPPGADPAAEAMAAVHPDQAGALALVINELLTNAVKHRSVSSPPDGWAQGVAARCTVTSNATQALLEIVNAGDWPDARMWDRFPPGVRGLGLAKALLPSRGAQLNFHTETGLVCARLQIGPPVWCPRVQSP